MSGRTTPAVLSALLALVALANPVAAGIREDLREQVRPTAEDIVKVMMQDKLKSVKFGAFVPPAEPTSAYATGLREILIEEVRSAAGRLGHTVNLVDRDPDVTIVATMSYKKEIEVGEKKETSVIQVKFQLEKLNGEFNLSKNLVETLGKVGKIIGDPALVTTIIGQNQEFKPDQPRTGPMGTSAQIEAERTKPGQSFQLIGDTKVKAAPGSPYAVEILVVDEKQLPKNIKEWEAIKPAKIGSTSDNKNPFIQLEPGKAYAIKVHIDKEFSSYDAAVEICIDGIDVFHFVDPALRHPDGRPKYQYYICPRPSQGGYSVIPGWHKDNQKSFAFVVREFGKGSLANVPKTPQGAPGVITVRIAGAWNPEEKDIPTHIKGKAAGKVETDKGPPVETGFVEVTKEIGKFNTVISIHYSH